MQDGHITDLLNVTGNFYNETFVLQMLAEGGFSYEDLSDGNLNDIIRVKTANKSLIAKRFPPFTKVCAPKTSLLTD